VPAATVVVVTAVVTVTVTAATPTAAPLSPGSSRASEALLLFRVQRPVSRAFDVRLFLSFLGVAFSCRHPPHFLAHYSLMEA
jgi:hypothetical protein